MQFFPDWQLLSNLLQPYLIMFLQNLKNIAYDCERVKETSESSLNPSIKRKPAFLMVGVFRDVSYISYDVPARASIKLKTYCFPLLLYCIPPTCHAAITFLLWLVNQSSVQAAGLMDGSNSLSICCFVSPSLQGCYQGFWLLVLLHHK